MVGDETQIHICEPESKKQCNGSTYTLQLPKNSEAGKCC